MDSYGLFLECASDLILANVLMELRVKHGRLNTGIYLSSLLSSFNSSNDRNIFKILYRKTKGKE